MDAKAAFDKRISDIHAIIETPTIIKDVALVTLRGIDRGSQMYNPVRNAIQALENIQDESIANSYTAIFNSACVLSVSALSDAFKSLFIEYANARGFSLREDFSKKLSMTVQELVEQAASNEQVARLIIDHDPEIKFEDLQSVVTSFNNYFQYDLRLTSAQEKSIIFYSQCRHVLAHAGGTVDQTFIRRTELRDANLQNYTIGDEVKLTLNDWEAMKQHFHSVVDNIDASIWGF